MRTLLAVLLFGLLAAPARAGTVSQVIKDSCNGDPTCEKYAQGQPVPVTTFTAAPGETNSVTVTRDGETFLVNDFASAVTAQTPCTQVDANTARCPYTAGSSPIPGVTVDAGDGDDAITIAGTDKTPTSLIGGDGNDTVAGGAGADRVDGGLGDDKLNGGGGADTLTYATRTADVTVSLKSGSGGQEGENDTLGGFEILLGGNGVDVLLGGPADDTIEGGPGADNVNGGAGDDTLFGGRGPDAIRGGPGDDLLYDDVGRNTFVGGSGRDKIYGGKDADTVFAGPGDDTVFLRGGSRDTVDCGKGRRDRAKTDKKDRRKHCERR
jgi:Ca2+-binding RTX toxin-like protein